MQKYFQISRTPFACLAMIAGLATGPAAHAGDLFIKETATAAGRSSGSLLLPVRASAANYWAGSQNISISESPGGASPTSFLAFCVDPAHFSSGSYTAYLRPATASNLTATFASRATAIQNLFDKYYGGTLGSNDASAAFQLALWEVANDDQVLTSGSVRINASTNSTLAANAAAMLADLAYSGPHRYDLTVFKVNRAVAGTAGQDYVVARPASVVSAIPEPQAYLLILAGLGMLGTAGSRRRAG